MNTLAYNFKPGGTDNLPKRGDVIVFRNPNRNDFAFVKRLIGFPGDRIQMKNGRLFINDKRIERKSLGSLNYTDYRDKNRDVIVFEEILPEGRAYYIYERSDRGQMDNTSIYIVPENHYFMMGDNRDGSADSRYFHAMGYIHQDWIIGKAIMKTYGKRSCSKPAEAEICPAKAPIARDFSLIN